MFVLKLSGTSIRLNTFIAKLITPPYFVGIKKKEKNMFGDYFHFVLIINLSTGS